MIAQLRAGDPRDTPRLMDLEAPRARQLDLETPSVRQRELGRWPRACWR